MNSVNFKGNYNERNFTMSVGAGIRPKSAGPRVEDEEAVREVKFLLEDVHRVRNLNAESLLARQRRTINTPLESERQSCLSETESHQDARYSKPLTHYTERSALRREKSNNSRQTLKGKKSVTLCTESPQTVWVPESRPESQNDIAGASPLLLRSRAASRSHSAAPSECLTQWSEPLKVRITGMDPSELDEASHFVDYGRTTHRWSEQACNVNYFEPLHLNGDEYPNPTHYATYSGPDSPDSANRKEVSFQATLHYADGGIDDVQQIRYHNTRKPQSVVSNREHDNITNRSGSLTPIRSPHVGFSIGAGIPTPVGARTPTRSTPQTPSFEYAMPNSYSSFPQIQKVQPLSPTSGVPISFSPMAVNPYFPRSILTSGNETDSTFTPTSAGALQPVSNLTPHEQHLLGQCQPCAYFLHKEDGCRQGDQCTFCHECNSEQLRRKRKEKQKKIKQEMKQRKAEERAKRNLERNALIARRRLF